MECVIIKEDDNYEIFGESGKETRRLNNDTFEIDSAQNNWYMLTFEGARFKVNSSGAEMTEANVKTNDKIQFLSDGIYILTKSTSTNFNSFTANVRKHSNLQADVFCHNNIVVIRVPTQLNCQYVGIKQKGRLLQSLNVKRKTAYHVMFSVDNTKDLIIFVKDWRVYAKHIMIAVFFFLIAAILNYSLNTYSTSEYKRVMLLVVIFIYLVFSIFLVLQPPIINDNVWFPLVISIFALLFFIQIMKIL